MKTDKGRMESVWLPKTLFHTIEKTREKLGMNRSAFYRYAIIKLLQDLGALEKVIQEYDADVAQEEKE